ncbi:hypothetical protein GCM10010297_22760 [Streptomyces malachitofuscus]|nr:hypothetical protein GCM10010297_22760 [Streptomyces malachitofuscus]
MTTALAPPVRMRKAAVAALGLLAVSTGALESVVAPTLPLLQRELDMSPAEGALLNIVLAITGTLITPIAGKLGDRYGGKRVLLRLMAVVSAGGLVSALAPNLPVLLLGQILQGAMVGALPLSFIVVRKHLPAGESKAAIGLVSGMFVGGSMVGLLSAGPVAEAFSRHWMFAVPTFAVVGCTLLVNRLMPSDPPVRSDDAGIDWPGLLLLSGILVTLMLVFALAPEAGSQPLVFLALIVVLAVLVTGWTAVERRAAAPMVDLRMLARPVIWKSSAVTFVLCLGTAMGDRLRIAVSDSSPRAPAKPVIVDWEATGGRGILLVEAMSAAWGSVPVSGGKQVWSEIVVPQGEPRDGQPEQRPGSRTE